LIIVVMVLLACFAALTVKLTQLQAVSPQRYAAQAKEQRSSTETISAPRGAILDRNGEPLVTTVTKRTVWADPKLVRDPKGAADALAPLLGRPAAELQRQHVADSRFEYLQRTVDDAVADQVEAMKLPGVFTLPEPTRFKPSGDLAGSVVGATDTDTNGISGVEKEFDEVLTGVPGEIVQDRSRDGHTIPTGEHQFEPAVAGSDVMLTLDRNLQHTVEMALMEQVKALSANDAAAVVMNPHTGEILAMASVLGGKVIQNAPQNIPITTTYEPGSVMKLVTMAAAIDGGIVSKDTVRKVPTSVEFYGERFRDDTRTEDEDMSVAEILARSSNVGTIELAKQVGAEALYGELREFGFGDRTGIGLAQEEPGVVPQLDDWSGTSLPTIAIGQGMTATPLQLLTAYNAIANGGELIEPTLVRAVIGHDGVEERRPQGEHRRVVTADTAAQLKDMFAGVVERGTGANASIDGYRIGGKTGTAWKVQEDGTYGSSGARNYVATFVGFAPVEDPRLSMVVVVDEPQGGRYSGGLAAAPVFASVAKQALVSLDVAPSAPDAARSPTGVNLRAKVSEPPPTTSTTTPPVVVGTQAGGPAAATASGGPGVGGATANASAADPTGPPGGSKPVQGANATTTATPPASQPTGAAKGTGAGAGHG
jgi:cell division protein FtsI (penicillin-binding protein 3)